MTTSIHASVVKANLKLLRFVLSFMLGAIAFSGVGLYWSRTLTQIQSIPPMLTILGHGLLCIAVLIGLGLLGFGTWMGQLGLQSLSQGCYPPSNSTVMCDTLLVTGWRATVKALTALMLATASLLSTLWIALEVLALLKL